MNIIEVDDTTHRVIGIAGMPLKDGERCTVLPTVEYDKLVALGRRAQRLYWRGFITGGVIIFVGVVAMVLLAEVK